jgi:MFS family permease
MREIQKCNFFFSNLSLPLSLSLSILCNGGDYEGVGLSSVICPMYVAELSPPERRGLLGSFFQLSITAGILIAYSIGYFLFNSQVKL